MPKHTCLRCGLEDRCCGGSLFDRHPWSFALPMAVFGLSAVCAYPWLLAVVAAAGVVYVADREHRRRAALAARADWEHQAVAERVASEMFSGSTVKRSVWHPVAILPTEPIRAH